MAWVLLLPIHHPNPKVKINEVFQVRQGSLCKNWGPGGSSSSQNCVDQVIHGDKIGKQIAHSCSFGRNPPRAGRTSQNCAGIQCRSVIHGPGVELP